MACMELRWVEPVEAAAMILEGGLAEILRRAVPGHFLPVAKRQLPVIRDA